MIDHSPQTEEACVEAGGHWGGWEVGRGRITGCNLPAKSAGKSCRSSEDCGDGVCLEQFDSSDPPSSPVEEASSEKRGICHTHQQYRGCGILIRDAATGNVNVMCVD